MRITSLDHENQLEFLYERTRGGNPWTLLTVDDFWCEARAMVAIAGPDFTPEGLQRYKRERGSQDFSQIGVGALPYYCQELDDLERLVICDFPPEDGWIQLLNSVLDRISSDSQLALLIDVYVDKQPERRIANEVLPALDELSIPLRRVAFLSVGGVPRDENIRNIRNIYKPRVINEEEGELREWWSLLLKGIDYGFFNNGCSQLDALHYPSRLAPYFESYNPHVRNFARRQANRESFGVWDWVSDVVESKEFDLSAKQYAWLCGKSFLQHSKDRAPDGRMSYTALRGLAHAFGTNFLTCFAPKTVKVMEIPATAPPPAVAPDKDPVDDPSCLGDYSTGGQAFEDFAEALRLWLDALHSEPGRPVRLASLTLSRGPVDCRLELRFDGVLPDRVFDRDEEGRARLGWAQVRKACAENRYSHEIRDGATVVTFRFPEVPRPDEKPRSESCV